jgi:uncharacterized protein (DUF697 family)
MTRKQLPRAITRTSDDLNAMAAAAAAGLIDEEAPRYAPQLHVVDDATAAEPALAVSSAPIANDVNAEAPALGGPLAAKRRALARKIVARHKNYAALGGLVPLPVANIAGVTAINLRMVKQLSALYQVPFQRDRTRALIVGLIGGAVPTGVGTATSSMLMFVVPGGLLLGLGAAALTAGALTRGIGLVFIESFESEAVARGAAR